MRYISLLLFCVVAVGCQKAPSTVMKSEPTPVLSPSASTVESATVKPKFDACSLLTSGEIQSIQGEAFKETKLSGQTSGGLAISQCFFALPTFENSVSLVVAQKGDGPGARDPKEFWRSTFYDKKERNESGKKAEKKEEREEEEEESEPPKRIPGLGDDAFWMGNRIAGAIYVLKGNAYVRVSVGGASDKGQPRARVLAQKAIARL